MALSLLEASKTLPASTERAVIEVYAQTSKVLQQAPMLVEPNGIFKWKVATTLPSVAARAIGSDFSQSNAQVEEKISVAKAYGSKIGVDDYIRKTNPGRIELEKRTQIAALARQVTVDVFEGSAGDSMRGLRDWAQNDTYWNSQNIATGGATVPLTMSACDLLLKNVNVIPGQTYLYMNYANWNQITTIARTGNATGSQSVVWSPDQFGNSTPTYAGVPIVLMQDENGDDMLSKVENGNANTGGSGSSVYCVTWSPVMTTMFQVANPTVQTLNDGSNFVYDRVDHYLAVVPQKKRSFARIYNLTSA